MFDIQLIQDAGVLTGIGIVTAFGLLVLLMITTSLTGQLTTRVFDRTYREHVPTSEELERERRDKALAAIAAVTAVIENPDILDKSEIEAD